jgi:hypothetical protein
LLSAAQAALHDVFVGDCIQAAIGAAAPLDTILIHDGVYVESVVLDGHVLTIGSAFLLDGDTTHICQTVIAPDEARPDTESCFVYSHAEPPGNQLVGLKLLEGRGTYWNDGNGYAGGAVYIRHAELRMNGCQVISSSADYGGGIAVIGSVMAPDAKLILDGSTILDCESALWGGGMYAYQCSVYVHGTTFQNDRSLGADGGGLITIATYKEVDSCTFRGCSGVIGGFACNGRGGYVANCLFEENESIYPWMSTDLEVSGEPHVVFHNVFRRNHSGTTAVGLCCASDNSVSFLDNIVEQDIARNGLGVFVIAGISGEIAYNTFRHNGASNSGTLYGLQNSHARVHHNVFEDNGSIDPNEGSVFVAGPGSHVALDSNLFFNNRGQTVTYAGTYHSTIDARNNWWGAATGPYHPTQNPGGQGDTLLSDSVLFIPWLTEPPDTSFPQSIGERRPKANPGTWELLDVYPNPFNQSLTLVLAGFGEKDLEIGLYNLLGQQVDVVHRGAMTGGQLHYQAPSWLASGVYLLSAQDRHGVQTRKVVLLK